MIGIYGAIFWLVVAVILLVVEALTVQMVCIWFAGGALFAMLSSFLHWHFFYQLVVFLVASIAILLVFRPIFMNRIKGHKIPTNADRVLGQVGVVLEQVNNMEQTGRVSADGLHWTARSVYGDIIPAGTKVVVKYMDGVKLIVEPLAAIPQPVSESLGDSEA